VETNHPLRYERDVTDCPPVVRQIAMCVRLTIRRLFVEMQQLTFTWVWLLTRALDIRRNTCLMSVAETWPTLPSITPPPPFNHPGVSGKANDKEK
jgi:hypothetical protein